MKKPIWLLLSFLALSVPAFAAEPHDFAEVDAVTPASPLVSAAASVNLRGHLEFQRGVVYDPVGDFNLTVNEGETSIIDVTYKREPFVSQYRITGAPAVDRHGQPAWSLHVVRQDMIGEQEVGPAKVADLMLNPGERISLISKGAYRGQPRNLRLTLGY